ncbi:hypothetical protein M9Y10_014653 [Tritrichomonas musculus]|uniref:Uncharacterized protein n=1 Tax=Tritrichomonas musculus TaxID=1915356 RepID=A0ABR2L102_9EUKA
MLFLSLLLIRSYQAECTPVQQGEAGTCATCDQVTNLCQVCNYPDIFQPNENGTCSRRPPSKCIPKENGEAGSCKTCNTTADLCQVCNYNDQYEPNDLGNCSIIQRKCSQIDKGAAGTCAECDTEADVCRICNYPEKYIPNELGNCSQKPPRCTPTPNGAAGTCSECDTEADVCKSCNYPDKYIPNQLGNCSLKPRCNPIPGGPEGSCAVCNTEEDICQICNFNGQYAPNQNGTCTLIPKKCVPTPNGPAGSCSVCNPITDLCEECNYANDYMPNENGTCSPFKPNCTEVQLGAAGTCSICNSTTNLCEVCNYANDHVPNKYGNCSYQAPTKCINVTDGAAGTCGICNPQLNLCSYCNYPEIYEPDQHGGCQMRTQAQCTETPYGAAGTCSVCNLRTHLCEVCNYPGNYAPNPFGNCSMKSRNGCSQLVSNCFKCDKKDPNKCTECQYGYGLRGGYCTKCAPHLYEDSRHPCNPDCSIIPNCHIGRKYDDDDCATENGQIYCLTCQSGYHPSDDYQSCIEDTPGSCSYNIPGCLECAYNGSRKCVKCDESKNFILDREDGECECKRGFEYVLGECMRAREVECDKHDKNLKKCDKCAFNSSTCIECDDDYGLENNQCVKCPKGGYVSGELPCLKPCTSMPNCAFCTDDGSYCFKCENGYEESDDHKKCYSEGHADCVNVLGCTKCSKSDPTFCLKCDKKNHFEESDIFPGTCVCDEDYDFVNNQCVEPFSPVAPPQQPQDQYQIDQTETIFYQYVIVSGSMYTILSNATFVPGTLYILLVPIKITKIVIPRGPTYFQLNIPQPSTGEGVTVNADPSTQVDLSCPNGANIVIPDNNNNYVLKGSGLITIDPPSGSTSVFLKKISLDQSGNTMTLTSTKAQINVREVEVYGKQSVIGQATIYNTVIETTKIQSGSEFSPENLTLTTLKIGIQSVLFVKGNSRVKITNYQVYYNSSNVNKIPIQFISPFPDFSNSNVQIVNMSQGAHLQEGEETFKIASFTGENSQQACQNFKYNGGDQFTSTECVTQGATTVKIAKRAVSPDQGGGDGGKKKKGLSGGAIAGIVVGCVVAVGLVVFLCIWFLVVKKKAIPAHPRTGEPAGSREKLEI